MCPISIMGLFVLLASYNYGEAYECPGCKQTQRGSEYIGKCSTTQSGRTCQAWSSQSPHPHNMTTKNGFVFPDGSDVAAANYCRNPDNYILGPWCYTTDRDYRWDTCAIRVCNAECEGCKQTQQGSEYIGKCSTTQSGRTCQAWASQSPHPHNMTTENGFVFPDGSDVAAANYCRNPDNYLLGPWCYTTDRDYRWDTCVIGQCNCKGCEQTELWKEYTGKCSTTQSGRTCQAWASQSPYEHMFNKVTKNGFVFPDGSDVAAANYCRNPDNNIFGPWCYTTDNWYRWDTCDIKKCNVECEGCKHSQLGTEYTGKCSTTQTGRTCQAWASQSPHQHSRTTENGFVFPDGSDVAAANYCRNPDNNILGPWCYTTDNWYRWDTCDIKKCKCRITEKGTQYDGAISHTSSGLKCQAWSSQWPHKHNPYHGFPDGTEAEAKNYCRNPGGILEKPWCLTTNSSTRWEYCEVPFCDYTGCGACKTTERGQEFVGKCRKTRSGRQCQAWSYQFPHQHDYSVKNGYSFPDGNEDYALNYCRNPDNSEEGPWCLTTDVNVRREYCDIKKC